MIIILLINLFISLLSLKLYYEIFQEKIFYPFRVAELYAYLTANTLLFFFNYFYYNFNVVLIFLLFNTLIFYIFYHLLNMIQTSPRTKILLDLLKLEKINLSEYYKKYNINIIVENRLKRFDSSNQIKIINNKIFFNKNKSFVLKILSIIFLLIKKL